MHKTPVDERACPDHSDGQTAHEMHVDGGCVMHTHDQTWLEQSHTAGVKGASALRKMIPQSTVR